MSIHQSYGSYAELLGPNFTAVMIEVKRTGQRQRPVSVCASYMPTQKGGGVPTDIDATITGRLVVYRGSIANITDDELLWVPQNTIPWPQYLEAPDMRVILDTFITWGRPFQESFATWPDAVVLGEQSESLGAALIQCVYPNQNAGAYATANLTLWGMDVPDITPNLKYKAV